LPHEITQALEALLIYWLFLFIAIVLEVIATSFLKQSNGWTKLLPTIYAVILFPSSTLIYSLALKKIDISIAYAVWSGLGTALMVIIGWYFFKEQISAQKLFFIALILVGITGLRFS
jgi:small multidrug resistance pump